VIKSVLKVQEILKGFADSMNAYYKRTGNPKEIAIPRIGETLDGIAPKIPSTHEGATDFAPTLLPVASFTEAPTSTTSTTTTTQAEGDEALGEHELEAIFKSRWGDQNMKNAIEYHHKLYKDEKITKKNIETEMDYIDAIHTFQKIKATDKPTKRNIWILSNCLSALSPDNKLSDPIKFEIAKSIVAKKENSLKKEPMNRDDIRAVVSQYVNNVSQQKNFQFQHKGLTWQASHVAVDSSVSQATNPLQQLKNCLNNKKDAQLKYQLHTLSFSTKIIDDDLLKSTKVGSYYIQFPYQKKKGASEFFLTMYAYPLLHAYQPIIKKLKEIAPIEP
jgi:hypothetical protein